MYFQALFLRTQVVEKKECGGGGGQGEQFSFLWMPKHGDIE